MAIPEEFKIILEDINEKFDILIEEHNGLNQKFDQLDRKIDREIEDRQAADMELMKEIRDVRSDLRELRSDLNEHRNNTELHGELLILPSSSHESPLTSHESPISA